MPRRATDDTPKKGKPPRDWRAAFLATLADTGNVRESCLTAGVDRRTAYRHREKDGAFAARWDEACDEACDTLELVARRRATEGTARPVYQGGKQVGTVQEYSDTLLIFLLKANRPEKYRDNYDIKALVEQLRLQNAAAPPAAGAEGG